MLAGTPYDNALKLNQEFLTTHQQLTITMIKTEAASN